MRLNTYRRFDSVVLIFAVLFCFVSAGCQEKNATSEIIRGKGLFEYERTVLDNGLEVVTLEDFSTPIVAAQVWYHVGSKDENPKRQGFAHMFEHMMFKGTDRVGDSEHFKFIQQVGGTDNAYTSFDATVYVQTLPANQLELALWLEAERMSFLRIDQNSFDTERKVVEEELRMRENRPYGGLMKKEFAALFKKHPYRWTPIGKLAHLRASSVAELRQFWTENYVPDNATLVIVGAVKHSEAQRLAKKYFAWIPRHGKPKRSKIVEPKQKTERILIVDDENAPAGLVEMVWRTVPLGHKDEAVLDLLSEILGGGNSSRIYRDLVAEKQIAVSATAHTYNLEDDGIFSVDITQAPAADANDIIDSLKSHIANIAGVGVTIAELDKAKNQMLKQVVTQNLTINSKARLLGNAAVKLGDISRVNTRLDEIRSVTREDIQRAAKKYLKPTAALVVIVKENKGGSKDSEESVVTADPELDPPKPGRKGVVRGDRFPKEAPFAELVNYKPTPEYSVTKLSNGLKVMVVENNEVPFVSIKLGLMGGAWTESKPATASMTLKMLTKGTAKHTEGQLAEELEKYAISLSGSAGMDTSQVRANCLSEHVERAVELMAEVVLSPSFDEDEFDKLVTQVVTALKIQEQTPRYLASKELRKRLYGKHPYARTVAGEVKDVEALKTANLKLWWSKWSRPDNASLIFAGDITKDKAVKIAERYFGEWKTGLIEMGLVMPNIPEITERHIYIVDRPSSAQSEIRIGGKGITRKAQPAYFTSRVVSNYFGGSFNSWLNDTVRIKKGLTYAVWGGYYAQNMAGSFQVTTFTKTEKTAETIKVLLGEIERLSTQEPDATELENTKSYFAGSFVRTRETPQAVAEDLWLIESQHLGSDYLDRLLETIGKTTAKDCIEFVRETTDPDKMVVVVVGDAEKIKDELEKIAPVTIVKY